MPYINISGVPLQIDEWDASLVPCLDAAFALIDLTLIPIYRFHGRAMMLVACPPGSAPEKHPAQEGKAHGCSSTMTTDATASYRAAKRAPPIFAALASRQFLLVLINLAFFWL